MNVGCVPKKIMWHVAEFGHAIQNGPQFGYGTAEQATEMTKNMNWNMVKQKRDAYIKRLNKIYASNLEKDHVDEHQGHATFLDPHTLRIKAFDGSTYKVKAKKILIATGGTPMVPSEKDIPGAKYGITSDGFFELEERPKRVVVVGAGYIAVELTGIFNSVGCESHLVIRNDSFLRTFDPMLSDVLMPHMRQFPVLQPSFLHLCPI